MFKNPPFPSVSLSFTLSAPPHIVTSLGHSELEDDAEEDAEGDDAKDDPDDDEVAGAASEALVFLRRRRRSFVTGGALSHRKLVGGPSNISI